MRILLVKLLMRCTLDVSIDSSGILPEAPESTQFMEAFWRRRERVPGAGREPASVYYVTRKGRRQSRFRRCMGPRGPNASAGPALSASPYLDNSVSWCGRRHSRRRAPFDAAVMTSSIARATSSGLST
jgi:hypothetical protein